ncbi:PAS domain S-box protein [Ammoniphilus sp. YIM 78166]|uniref:PAS domain S-box protein n=1 Tax=Ammoniphilus sp. YIM 78166 TaxID=1644106 RepID=UPI001070020D|nr:PAS domain S-box protein [Ammoniphilus sp. YIM 78166]
MMQYIKPYIWIPLAYSIIAWAWITWLSNLGTFIVFSGLSLFLLTYSYLRKVELEKLKWQKKAEELQTILDTFPDLLVIKDADNQWISGSKVALDLFQISQTTPFKVPLTPSCLAAEAKAIASRSLERTEISFPSGNGKEICYDIIKAPLWNKDGSLQSMLTIGRDITQSKKMEQLLHKSQEWYCSIFNNSPYAIAVTDIEGRVLDVNPAFTQIYGFNLEEARDKVLPMVPPTMHPDVKQWNLRLVAGESFRNVDTIGLTKDGREIHVTFSASTISNEDGEIRIFSMAQDITKQKEEEKQYSYTKDLFESFFRYTADIVILTDQHGMITQANPSFERILGCKAESVIGRNILDSEQAQDFTNFVYRVNKGESVGNIERTLETSDGRIIDASITFSVIRNQASEIIGYSAVIRDISETKWAMNQLKKTKKLSLAGNLAAGIAHEIRNPLTSIRGFLQFIQADCPEHTHPSFIIMLNELDRINEIVSEFLFLARPPQEKKEEILNIAEVSQQVIQFLQPQFLLKNVDVDWVGDSSSAFVKGDANQLKQVFINILRNASDSMEEHGGKISVTLTQQEQYISIAIQDKGCGISEERLQKIGEPFYTTKEKGTGLGMMMTFKIMEGHNGLIQIESKEGEGTLVELKLPALMTQTERKAR